MNFSSEGQAKKADSKALDESLDVTPEEATVFRGLHISDDDSRYDVGEFESDDDQDELENEPDDLKEESEKITSLELHSKILPESSVHDEVSQITTTNTTVATPETTGTTVEVEDSLPTLPSPSSQLKKISPPDRNPREAQVYMMENHWFNEKIWLYNDGVYAQRNPQNICGQWKKVEALLILISSQGGRQLFSPNTRGGWNAEAGGISTLRPDKN